MVAALASRGRQVISDDLCVFEASEQGVRVWPGLNRLRLWEDALAALGCDQPGIEREFRGLNKYLVPTQPIRNPQIHIACYASINLLPLRTAIPRP